MNYYPDINSKLQFQDLDIFFTILNGAQNNGNS